MHFKYSVFEAKGVRTSFPHRLHFTMNPYQKRQSFVPLLSGIDGQGDRLMRLSEEHQPSNTEDC